jgi:hypothetical protein
MVNENNDTTGEESLSVSQIKGIITRVITSVHIIIKL